MSFKTLLLPAFALAVFGPAAVGAQSVGIASWYGARHDGLRTSSGALFDQDGMTAASRSIPLGSRVRVTMHETGRSVVVLVNDRMGGRSAIIDLAKGAAREIGLLGRGRGTVSIDLADSEPVEIAEAEDDASDVPETAPRRRRSRRARVRLASCCHGGALALTRRAGQMHAAQVRTAQMHAARHQA